MEIYDALGGRSINFRSMAGGAQKYFNKTEHKAELNNGYLCHGCSISTFYRQLTNDFAGGNKSSINWRRIREPLPSFIGLTGNVEKLPCANERTTLRYRRGECNVPDVGAETTQSAE